MGLDDRGGQRRGNRDPLRRDRAIGDDQYVVVGQNAVGRFGAQPLQRALKPRLALPGRPGRVQCHGPEGAVQKL